MNIPVVFDSVASFWAPSASEGVSDDARALRSKIAAIHDDFDQVFSYQAFRDAHTAIDNAFLDAMHPDWDGYGAEPVTRETGEIAHALLDAFPTYLPAPEIAADPDGEMSFEWHAGYRRVFSISVASNRRLSYAGLDGLGSVHGTDAFRGQVPLPVLFHLVRILR